MRSSTDIVIHINEKLDNDHRERFSSEVCQVSGVLSANLPDNRPHLMIVAYNPVETKSVDVLSGVRDKGVHAQLVGWL